MGTLAERPKSRIELAFRALTRDPEAPSSGEDYFIHNKPPFVADLLADLNTIELQTRKSLWDDIVDQSHQYDSSYLISMMMRKAGDQTCLMGSLIGIIQNPEEALTVIKKEGTAVFAQINGLPNEERHAIFTMFNGGKANWKAILTLDRILDQTNENLKFGGFPKVTQDFRIANEDALKELYADDHRKQTLNNKHRGMDQKLQEAPWPTIVYDETDGSVRQQYLLPAMPAQNREQLEAILPEEISQTDNPVSPYSPLGIMCFINMAGHPFVRSAAQITQKLLREQSRQQILDSNQKVIDALRDYYETHG